MALLYPVLSIVPDFTKDPTYGVATMHDRLDMGAGRARVAFPHVQPDRLLAFDFVLDTTAEIQALKRFFLERGGRAHPFYLPSWRNDLPPVAGTAGSVLLQVQAVDYTETHLTEPANRPDHYGRQIFIWQPGEALHTSRVLAATELDGVTTLDLEDALPFTLIPRLAIVGFCFLARFGEDRLDWRHWKPELARVSVRCRGIRQHVLITQTNPVQGVAVEALPALVQVTQSPDPTTPSDNRCAYAAGPVNLHAAQDALYSTRWAIWTYQGRIRIKSLPTGEISLPENSGVSSSLFGTAVIGAVDHLTLAFDQNAWEVIAYQKSANRIQLRQYFNLEVVTREWDGYDPILVYNQLIDPNLSDGDSDVCCYYLKPSENVLFVRIQRENFETEHVAALLPLRPIALKRAFVEDELLKVEMLDVGFRRAVFQSAPLPEPPPPDPPPPEVETIIPPEAARAGLLISGTYDVATVYADGLPWGAPEHPPFVEAMATGLEPTLSYINVVIEGEGLEQAAHSGLSPTLTHTRVVIEGEGLAEPAAAGLTLPTFSHTLHAIAPPLSTDSATASLTPTLSYAPA